MSVIYRTPLLVQLSSFPLICIYILIDESTGNAYLQWSNGNGINQLANTITLLHRHIHDNALLQNAYNRQSLTLRVLKAYRTKQSAVLMRARAIILFKKTGYTDMNGKHHLIEYSFKTSVLSDYRDKYSKDPLVYVTVKSKSIGAIVCGVFDHMSEAEEFIHNLEMWDTFEFKDNELTKGYHKKYGYVLKKSC